MRRPNAASVLSFIAPILEESPASLASYAAPAPAPQPKKDQQQSTKPASPKEPSVPVEPSRLEPTTQAEDLEIEAKEVVLGPAVGPALPPGHVEGLSPDSESDDDVVGGIKRQLGPAMPSREMLEAAANLPVPVDEEESEDELVGPPPPEYEEEDAHGEDTQTDLLEDFEHIHSHCFYSSCFTIDVPCHLLISVSLPPSPSPCSING